MSAAPPYAEATCKCGHGNPPVSVLGRYRGLCEIGKETAVEASRRKREAASESEPKRPEIEEEVRLRTRRKGMLTRTIDELGKQATLLEEALEERKAAGVRARIVLGDFKKALEAVSHTAQSLLNESANSIRETNGNGAGS